MQDPRDPIKLIAEQRSVLRHMDRALELAMTNVLLDTLPPPEPKKRVSHRRRFALAAATYLVMANFVTTALPTVAVASTDDEPSAHVVQRVFGVPVEAPRIVLDHLIP